MNAYNYKLLAKRLIRYGFLVPALPINYLFSRGDSSSIIILNYHRVNNDQNDNDSVSTEQLEWQLEYITSNFDAIRLDEIETSSAKKGRIRVVVTFDDGYLDNYSVARPILERHNIRACFFLTTKFINTQYSAELYSQYGIKIPMMTWDHVRELHSADHLIGSHTMTHPNLTSIDHKMAVKEIVGSGKEIEKELGIKTRFFSYPYGNKYSYNQSLKNAVKQNYDICCNNRRGRNNHANLDLHDLYRACVQRWWRKIDFITELKGVYNFIDKLR